MKIIDLKSAIIGTNVCLRVVTDKGLSLIHISEPTRHG